MPNPATTVKRAHSISNRERSEVENNRQRDVEESQLMEDLRQSLERTSGKRQGEVRKLHFPIF